MGWFNGHFHLSHDYEDSITFPGGNNRGSCVFAQTGCMTARSSRDGRRHSRFIRGNEHGFEICTVDHSKGGIMRLDATVTYADECAADGEACSTLVFAHDHEDYDHDLWFQAYVPQEGDGCYIESPNGIINLPGSDLGDLSDPNAVCWWHMKDGAVLGVHNGMIIEYDESTLAPLGMVVSRDELQGRRVAVVDNGYGGSTCLLYDDENNSEVTVVQPNEDPRTGARSCGTRCTTRAKNATSTRRRSSSRRCCPTRTTTSCRPTVPTSPPWARSWACPRRRYRSRPRTRRSLPRAARSLPLLILSLEV